MAVLNAELADLAGPDSDFKVLSETQLRDKDDYLGGGKFAKKEAYLKKRESKGKYKGSLQSLKQENFQNRLKDFFSGFSQHDNPGGYFEPGLEYFECNTNKDELEQKISDNQDCNSC